MKTFVHTLAIGLLFASTAASAQEVSKVFGFSKPFPDSFEKGDCKSNMGLAPGIRVTMPMGDRFGIGLGLAHEWRSARTEQETENGTVPLSDVKGRAFLLQAMGQYRIFTCASKCQSSMGVMVGADVTLPYRTNALQYASDGSELTTDTDRDRMKAGLAFRAGLRYSVPLCEHMGFFMEPQLIYKAVLDRTDEAAQFGRSERTSDRLGMGMQGGIYMKLMCPGKCPVKASAQ
ncbi:MAG: hypothetical protein IPG10_10535 [Flavobacteriales bacterium]|jgi:hypothetical protein|nr:hypothetical protein [Flavobacteriales bacterium]MBK6753539.1 hypothetical protein [Flavobacteriales bacterium]MBK7083661.1 hypothetical protein [Flavobacteriales bacterium]MBK7269900.1 hypothetical protein [Flavobacteriales bacterium]MBK7753491.1 hypothetical protein [Flavobacteriales bacterium]